MNNDRLKPARPEGETGTFYSTTGPAGGPFFTLWDRMPGVIRNIGPRFALYEPCGVLVDVYERAADAERTACIMLMKPHAKDTGYLARWPIRERVTADRAYQDGFSDGAADAPLGLFADELATILAALRFYQEKGQGDPANRSAAIQDIADNGGEVISLDADAIDSLCERLNLATLAAPADQLKVSVLVEAATVAANELAAAGRYSEPACTKLKAALLPFPPPWSDACSCDERSWYGPEHDTACTLNGKREQDTQ